MKIHSVYGQLNLYLEIYWSKNQELCQNINFIMTTMKYQNAIINMHDINTAKLGLFKKQYIYFSNINVTFIFQ